MSETETTGPLSGTLTRTHNNEIITRGVAASEVLVIGDPITFDANGFMIKATDVIGNRAVGFGMVLETVTGGTSDADEIAQAAIGNTYVNIIMGGDVEPFELVKLNSSSKLIEQPFPANAAGPTNAEVDAARDFLGLAFGRYLRHPKEEKTPTDAANNDVGVIRLGVD